MLYYTWCVLLLFFIFKQSVSFFLTTVSRPYQWTTLLPGWLFRKSAIMSESWPCQQCTETAISTMLV